MKIIRETTNKAGRRVVTVELAQGENLLPVRLDCHYKLGYPVEDIIEGHIIDEMVKVRWCSLEQKWIS